VDLQLAETNPEQICQSKKRVEQAQILINAASEKADVPSYLSLAGAAVSPYVTTNE
jgi:hypothetical protein